jgi:cyclic pyranopterin phosphate synthase
LKPLSPSLLVLLHLPQVSSIPLRKRIILSMSICFTHLRSDNAPSMVDVGQKQATARFARARAIVELDAVIAALLEGDGDGAEIPTPKGAVFQTAIIAGIMAAKKTGELIPLCHPLPIEHCAVEIRAEREPDGRALVIIECSASLTGKTGVEMEALTGASVAALTVYDMCKSVSRGVVIRETRLLEKRGGKSDGGKY